jgi:hypothetical protein
LPSTSRSRRARRLRRSQTRTPSSVVVMHCYVSLTHCFSGDGILFPAKHNQQERCSKSNKSAICREFNASDVLCSVPAATCALDAGRPASASV